MAASGAYPNKQVQDLRSRTSQSNESAKSKEAPAKWKFLGFGRRDSATNEKVKEPEEKAGFFEKVRIALNLARPQTVEKLRVPTDTEVETHDVPFVCVGGVYHHNPTPPVRTKPKCRETLEEMYEWKSVYKKEFYPMIMTASLPKQKGPFAPNIDPRSMTHHDFKDPALVNKTKAVESARFRDAMHHQTHEETRKADLVLKMKRFKTRI